MTFARRPMSSSKRRRPSEEELADARATPVRVVSLAEVDSTPVRRGTSSRLGRRSGNPERDREEALAGDAPVVRDSEQRKPSKKPPKRFNVVAGEDGEVRIRKVSRWGTRTDTVNADGEVRSSEVRAQREAASAQAANARAQRDAEAIANGTATDAQLNRKTRMERQPPSALSYVIWLLSRRDYSEKELRQKLALKEHTPEAIDAAILQAQTYGYQSDQRFAEVQTRQKANAAGDRKLRMQMKTKGVDVDVIEQALEALPDENHRAFEAMRRFRGKTPDAALHQKAFRFLAGRGFSFDSIKFAWAHTFGKDACDDLDLVDDPGLDD